MVSETAFAMANKASPLAFTRVCRLALNGEQSAQGVFAKRRGITTAVTVDLVIGTTAPFRAIRWKIGSSYYLVAVGSDADAFLNPWNNWLYARSPTFPTGRIYSGPTLILKEGWGIAKPTATGAATSNVDVDSLFGTSGYLYAVTSWNEARKVESEPVFLLSTGFPEIDGLETLKLVWVMGMGSSAGIPAITPVADATSIRYYRERMIGIQGTAKTGYVISCPGDASHLRFIDEKNDGAAWTDSGGQALSRLLDYCYDVVPWASRSAALKDGWLYLTTPTETPCAYKLIKSNPMCPETYAGNKKSVIAETDAGLMQGQSEWPIPVDCGVPVGLAVQGGTALVLCDHGAWRLVDGPASGLYTLMQDHTWVGCVSAATIAHSPEGTWWLAKEGIVLWRSADSQPEVITLDTIDTADSDTPFAADLSGAMGAYDVARHCYKVIVPKLGGGQFMLVVRGDRLPHEIVVAKWTFSTSLPITGMGYDWYADQVVYFFGTYADLTAKAETPSVYTEGDPAATYPFTVEEWWGETGGKTPETKRSVAVRVFLHRTSTAGYESAYVWMQGLRTTEEPTAPAPKVLTWGPGETEAKITEPSSDILGRMVKVTLMTQSAYPLEFRCIQIGEAAEIRALEGVT